MTDSPSPSKFEISGRTWCLRAAKSGSAKQPTKNANLSLETIYVGTKLEKNLAGTIARRNQIAFVGQGQKMVFPALPPSGKER